MSPRNAPRGNLIGIAENALLLVSVFVVIVGMFGSISIAQELFEDETLYVE